MKNSFVHTSSLMGTVVTFHVIGHGGTDLERAERVAAVERAVGWFEQVTATCSRFLPDNELVQLSDRIGEFVPVSALLFETVQFALHVAEQTNGAFDPTVGHRMALRGFNQEFRSGRAAHVDVAGDGTASYRDVVLDPDGRTITLLRPLVLDLGAVAKGMAIDMAARELQPFRDFAIDAGGDLYLGGSNARGEPWSVGIRHPRKRNALIETLRVSDAAVCTSGDYERRRKADPGIHHILDARSGATATAVASATVVAPTAMAADALSTAAFVLGTAEGVDLLEHEGVEGLLFTPTLERFTTRGMRTEHLGALR
jgi:FAD:protein FMN transferase